MQSIYWIILGSETTPSTFFFFKHFCCVILMFGRFLSQNNIVRRTLEKSRWTALLLFLGESWQEVESESLTTLGWDGIQCRHIFLIHNTIDTRFVYTIDTRKHFHSVFFLAFLKRGAFMSILLKCKEDCVTHVTNGIIWKYPLLVLINRYWMQALLALHWYSSKASPSSVLSNWNWVTLCNWSWVTLLMRLMWICSGKVMLSTVFNQNY